MAKDNRVQTGRRRGESVAEFERRKKREGTPTTPEAPTGGPPQPIPGGMPSVPTPGTHPNYSGLQEIFNQIFGADPDIEKTATGGFNLAHQFFGPGSLGRIDETLPPETVELLMRGKGESYVGGARTPETQFGIDALRRSVEESRNQDPNVTMALEKMKQGLGGLTPEELQGIREGGTENINREMQTGLRSANMRALSQGLQGGAGAKLANPYIAQSLQQQRGLEGDIARFNTGLKDTRLGSFGNYAGEQAQNLFGRQQQAATNYVTGQQGVKTGEIADRRQRLLDYENLYFNVLSDQARRHEFNLNRAAAENAGLLGGIFGGAQWGAGQKQADRAYELGLKGIEASKIEFPDFGELFAGGGGGEDDGGDFVPNYDVFSQSFQGPSANAQGSSGPTTRSITGPAGS